MQSHCSVREASKANCSFHGCCPVPLIPLQQDRHSQLITPLVHIQFAEATTSSLSPNHEFFTNHESLLSLQNSFSNFTTSYPQYNDSKTELIDQIRSREYSNLSTSNHVCLDYIGIGLFSYAQNLVLPFFDISHKSVNLMTLITTQLLISCGENNSSDPELKIRERIFSIMNISEADYNMVFTPTETSSFKLLSSLYPFNSSKDLITVYDYKNEALESMIQDSKRKGASVKSAEFTWPDFTIFSRKLTKMMVNNQGKKKKRKMKNQGLFVFPVQSRITGSRYSYSWMSIAQENGFHVLLDASALGPKDMSTLGLSVFKPDFVISSFYKVFGHNPSGFSCLFLKKTTLSFLQQGSISTDNYATISVLSSSTQPTTNGLSISEIVEIEKPLEFRALDHADLLGLSVISRRSRCLINWLINALMSLKHPSFGHLLVRIYGPKVSFDRGPFLAFNVFDWKKDKIEPEIVQKLADRNNISLSCGILKNFRFGDKGEEEREMMIERERSIEDDDDDGGISVVSVALGFLTHFEDVYRVWVFVSLFLDADFVEKERWRYFSLNQKTIIV